MGRHSLDSGKDVVAKGMRFLVKRVTSIAVENGSQTIEKSTLVLRITTVGGKMDSPAWKTVTTVGGIGSAEKGMESLQGRSLRLPKFRDRHRGLRRLSLSKPVPNNDGLGSFFISRFDPEASGRH